MFYIKLDLVKSDLHKNFMYNFLNINIINVLKNR